ncbi:MAG: insulinase family protein [Candidatus Krumholzibacteria bacterium]|nr:insulinase family protein [Candidatus Krumholzibacteria bacterium]
MIDAASTARTVRTFFAACAALAGLSSPLPAAQAGRTGAPEVILEPRSGSGAVLVAVVVEAGSAWESPETRGVTHMLEHLLFDGSERLSREQIGRWTDDNGVFLNAFTRKESTVYFLLARADLLEESLEILSQMLLHPIFPLEEIEKERGVVLEEIAHTLSAPEAAREREADRRLFRGSPLAEPVLGYPATIAAVSRAEIAAYHRSRYRPDRMRILLMGEFDGGAALGWISDYFSVPGERRAAPADRDRSVLEPRWSGEIAVRPAGDRPHRLELLVRMPAFDERLFPAALLLPSLIVAEGSPLAAAAREAGLAPPSASLEVYRSFSALRLVFEQDRGSGDPSAMAAAVAALAGWAPSPERLAAERTAFASSHSFDGEKYHYYLMLHGDIIAAAGARHFEAVAEAGTVGVRDVERLTGEVFGNLRSNGVLFAGEGAPGPPPDGAEAHFGEIPGGPALAAASRPGSQVAALTLLFPEVCIEGAPQGASLLLHGIMEHGRSGKDLASKLGALGARLRWSDNPYVPMDDYLESPSHAFVTLEAPAEKIEEAALALARFLRSFEATAEEIEAAAPAVARESAARRGSSPAVLRDEVYRRLFPGHPYGASGVPDGAIAAAGAQGLEEHRASLHAGSGAVAALVSPLAGEEATALLERVFSAYPAGARPSCPPLPSREPGPAEGESGRETASLAAAWRIDAPSAEEAAALEIACEVLGRRMQQQIREVEGLAYSTGCSLRLLPGTAVALAAVTTRGENEEEAAAALATEIARLSAEPPADGEIATARSRAVSRLMRRFLDSAGQSFGLAEDVVLRGGRDESALLAGVPAGAVREAARLLDPGSALRVDLRGSGGSPEKKSLPPGMMRR